MNQRQRVLKMLTDAGPKGVSSKTFIASYLPRAAARIQELKDEGVPITTEREGKYVRYRLAPSSYGYCQCGCGGKTNLAEKTRRSTGAVKGEPQRYLVGHQNRKTGPLFEEDPDTGYWLWLLHKDQLGYGRAWRDGKNGPAHRAIYEELVGPVPPGSDLDHLCRNRACVNPGHLEPVSHVENVRRGARAELTEEQVAEIKSLDGTNEALAQQFGVHKDTIRDIRAGRTWKDVQPLPIVGVGGSTVARGHVDARVYPSDSGEARTGDQDQAVGDVTSTRQPVETVSGAPARSVPSMFDPDVDWTAAA